MLAARCDRWVLQQRPQFLKSRPAAALPLPRLQTTEAKRLQEMRSVPELGACARPVLIGPGKPRPQPPEALLERRRSGWLAYGLGVAGAVGWPN